MSVKRETVRIGDRRYCLSHLMTGAKYKTVCSLTYSQLTPERRLRPTFFICLFIPEMLIPFLMSTVSLLQTSSLLHGTGMFVPVAKHTCLSSLFCTCAVKIYTLGYLQIMDVNLFIMAQLSNNYHSVIRKLEDHNE